MEIVYLDNNVMNKIFKPETMDFYKKIYPKIKDKGLLFSNTFFLEFYGITRNNLKDEFHIKEELQRLHENHSKLFSSSKNVVNSFNKYSDDIRKIFEEKMTLKDFKNFLNNKIQKKENSLKEKYNDRSLTKCHLLFYKDVIGKGKILNNYTSIREQLILSEYMCYDFSNTEGLKNWKNRSKKLLARHIEVEMFKKVCDEITLPFYQILTIVWKIRKSVRCDKHKRNVEKVYEYLCNEYNKIKFHADMIDSEILFLSIYGNFNGRKPIKCYTTDCYSKIMKRWIIFYQLWNGSISSIKECSQKFRKDIDGSKLQWQEESLGQIVCIKDNNPNDFKIIDLNNPETKNELEKFDSFFK